MITAFLKLSGSDVHAYGPVCFEVLPEAKSSIQLRIDDLPKKWVEYIQKENLLRGADTTVATSTTIATGQYEYEFVVTEKPVFVRARDLNPQIHYPVILIHPMWWDF